MDYMREFHYCKAEVEQRHRDIARAVEKAQKITREPLVWDLLGDIFHHSVATFSRSA